MSCRTIFSCVVALTLISSCSTSKVLAVGNELYIVTSSGAGFDTGGVRENVYNEANKFCAQNGKVIETVSFESVRGKLASHPPSAELKFRCVNK